jgi:hypothetical protein
MIRLSPRLLIATASALVGLGANPSDHLPGGNIDRLRGEAVQRWTPAQRSWDAALIHHCGYWAHFDYRGGKSSWPLPAFARTAELARLGAEGGVMREEPQEGDLFLQYMPRKREFVRTGIVTEVVEGWHSRTERSYDVGVIEGDTDAQGRLYGGMVAHVRRRLMPSAGDRFVRWVELEEYDRTLARGIFVYEATMSRRA